MIPAPANDPRVYWEKLRDPVYLSADGILVAIEPCSPGFVHAVTVDDALRVLGMLPAKDVARIRTLAFRQPSRKQTILSCVWGRLAYFAKFRRVEGPAVILEAQRPGEKLEWPRALRPEDAEEIERLQADGHAVTRGRRSWTVRTTLESIRATQLFRTLPHEVGHHVQYDREVRQRAAGDPSELLRLQNAYFARPPHERDSYADRYAREFVDRRTRERRLPFARLADGPRMKRQGLQLDWFGLE